MGGMTDTLAARAARYGLMASLILIALDALQRRAQQSGDSHVVPRGEEADRLRRLREVLAGSYFGGVPVSARDPQQLMPPVAPTVHGSADDSIIVKGVLKQLPRDWSLEQFVPEADATLQALLTVGIDRLGDHEDFYVHALKPFLEGLAQSSQREPISSRSVSRRRYSLL
jgi:hypothetical protein